MKGGLGESVKRMIRMIAGFVITEASLSGNKRRTIFQEEFSIEAFVGYFWNVKILIKVIIKHLRTEIYGL